MSRGDERAGLPGLQPRGPASCGGPAVANLKKNFLLFFLLLLYFLLYFAFAFGNNSNLFVKLSVECNNAGTYTQARRGGGQIVRGPAMFRGPQSII